MSDEKTENLTDAMRAAYPELEAVATAADAPVYLVGGAIRELLLGRGRSENLDLVVLGDAAALAASLGGEDPVAHERFATARAMLGGLEVDIASARTETYPHPGALPVVEPVDEIGADLARRDFTINAIAVPIDGGDLVDPHGGRADLAGRMLRVLHPGSFLDDPTRALRAARYAARLDLTLEEETAALLRATDLGTVSADRRENELLRIASEPEAARAFELLDEWGLVETRPGGVELAATVAELLGSPPWSELADRDRTILSAALGPPGAEKDLAAAAPDSPSEGVELARGRSPMELALGRALGAAWLDRYLDEWRSVTLEIDGRDLVEAGVPEGPAVGRGLAAALRAKLDGKIDPGRAAELAAALAAARSDGGLA